MRRQAITLTDAAVERIRGLLARNAEAKALRLGVRSTGCSGMSYTVEYASEIRPQDEVVEDKGVTVVIDPAASLFLIGCEVDYTTDKFRSGFVFRNPNEKSRCGCGESFSV
jgi:iron-sulfur cluster assembly protein